jgi:transcriptional regulator with XRE-family HTH domain
MTTTENKRKFADRLGVSPSYVTQLLKDERLVMAEDGKLVNVEASLRLIDQTSGDRGDVSDRWKNAREAKSKSSEQNYQESTQQRSTSQADAAEKIGSSLQAARAVKEKYAAMTAKIEYERLIGELESTEAVHADLRSFGAALRAAMDVFPDQVTPLVAPTLDMNEVHEILTQNCTDVLRRVSDEIMKLRYINPLESH